MNELKLSVNGNCLAVTEDTVSTPGSVNFDECSFTFNEEWDGFTKTAVFSTDNDDCYKVSVENNSCTIPSVCMEKEGIIRIAVYGIKDEETIITTNSVAHRVSEGIGEVTEWIEEDFSLAQNAINELAAEFNEFRFNTTRYLGIVSSQLTSLGNEIDEFSVSKPDWYIPEAVEDATSCPITTAGNTYDDFLAFKLDKLVEDFPDYVSKNSIGTDHAGDYQVYAYTFEPEKYNKTVMITSYTHGTDRVAFLSLNYLLDYLCRGDDEILRYIKNNVKLQVVPVVNPYGLSNVKTNNVLNVNINMNYPTANWEDFDTPYKGDAGGDQVETQNIIDFLEEIKDDKLCAVLDLHTSTSVVAGRTIYYPRYKNNCLGALTKLINQFNYEVESDDPISTAVLAPLNHPSLINYVAEQYDINACELVWNNSIYGGVFDNYTLTKYVEFIGNALYTLAENSSFIKKLKPEPFVKHFLWKSSGSDDVYTIPESQNLRRMGISSYSFKIDMPCAMTANGYVTLNVESACTVKINPVLYQINSAEQDYLDRLNSTAFMHELYLSPGVHVIPVSTVLQAYYSCFNGMEDTFYSEDVIFVLAFSCSDYHAAYVTGFSVTINAVPSDLGKPVEVSTPMGITSDYNENDIPTQEIIFPLSQYTELDDYYFD